MRSILAGGFGSGPCWLRDVLVAQLAWKVVSGGSGGMVRSTDLRALVMTRSPGSPAGFRSPDLRPPEEDLIVSVLVSLGATRRRGLRVDVVVVVVWWAFLVALLRGTRIHVTQGSSCVGDILKPHAVTAWRRS